MNTDRLFKTVIMELTTDLLKAEADLEHAINEDTLSESKINKIKYILATIVSIESSLAKFGSMVNNTNQKKENNGTI
jgi:hypothetical protein